MRAMFWLPIKSLSHRRITWFTCLLAITTSASHADVTAEREALVRIVHELDSLQPLIDSAESEANPDARVRFRYDWLRADLKKIERGIQEHINAPRVEPRSVPPLRGDYRQ